MESELRARLRRRERAERLLWLHVSESIDQGMSPLRAADLLGVSRYALYQGLKRWVPDRSGDGGSRWYTDGFRYHRGSGVDVGPASWESTLYDKRPASEG